MKKSIDVLAQRILAIGLSITMILGVTLFGIASITNNSAKADYAPITNATGKIMMSESGFVINGQVAFHILVWDTETGKSKLYSFNTKNISMEKAPYQIPSSPLY